MTIVAALLVGAIAALGQEAPEGNASASISAEDMLFNLPLIQADMQGSLSDMDSDVANVSQSLSATGLKGAGSREVQSSLFESKPARYRYDQRGMER